jgi:hypothetical protein
LEKVTRASDKNVYYYFEFFNASLALLLESVIVELLTFGSVMLTCFFHVSCVYALGFAYLRLSHWLDILTTCTFSVEIFSMFGQDCVDVKFLTTGLVV